MTYAEIEAIVKEVIVELFLPDSLPQDIESNESLLFGGVGLDSVSTITLVVALEEKFDIIIDDDDLRLELFSTIHVLSEYIFKLLHGAS